MGVIKYVSRNCSIKKQFIFFFIAGVLISILLSILMITSFLILSSDMKSMLTMEGFVDKNISQISSKSYFDVINQEASNLKIKYWVIRKDEIQSSNIKEDYPKGLVIGKKKYIRKIKIKKQEKTYLFSYKPLIVDDKIKGAIILRYKNYFLYDIRFIYNMASGTSYEAFFNLFFTLPVIMITPIITIVVLSILFAKGFRMPLQTIIEASDKIRKEDLNFVIDTSYNNEIGKVMEAMEDMRATLEVSLKTQWKMTEERKDMILALVHDIKTPITVICGHLELLNGSYKNISEEDRLKYLKVLMNNSDQVKYLINELNEVWDLERPEFRLQKKEVKLADYFLDIEDKFVCICIERGIQFKVIHEFKDQESYIFDPNRMEEVIDNIVSNALKYTPDKGNIILESFLRNKSFIIQIRDSGKGFEEKEINKLFTRYYKGRQSITSRTSSGLGLYICHLIVQKHGGIIRAYNKAEAGAEIEVTI